MKIHQENKKINSNSVIIKVNKMSSSKKYNCHYCKNEYSLRQSKWRHERDCDKKSELKDRKKIK